MKKEIADKWVAALRSGEYAQDNGQLKSEKGFCCLGVLCDLYEKENPSSAIHENGADYYFNDHSYTPRQVRDWAGLGRPGGAPPDYCDFKVGGKMVASLAHANDQGATFAEIADCIEQIYEKL